MCVITCSCCDIREGQADGLGGVLKARVRNTWDYMHDFTCGISVNKFKHKITLFSHSTFSTSGKLT